MNSHCCLLPQCFALPCRSGFPIATPLTKICSGREKCSVRQVIITDFIAKSTAVFSGMWQGRKARQDAQFHYTRFCRRFGVLRVVRDTRLRLLCAVDQRATFIVNAAMVAGRWHGSTAREHFPCTRSLTLSTRLDRLQVPFVKSSVWPDWKSNPVYKL